MVWGGEWCGVGSGGGWGREWCGVWGRKWHDIIQHEKIVLQIFGEAFQEA